MPMEKETSKDCKPLAAWAYHTGEEQNPFPWGPHDMPLSLGIEGVNLTIEKREGYTFYRREGNLGEAEKVLLSDRGKMLLSPVEPFHLPAALSTHLLIEFALPVLLEPRSKKNIMLTFPLELACAIDRRRAGEQVIDIFSFNRPKFTLYGSVSSGLLCKYWRSEVFSGLPVLNPAHHGMLRLTLHNPGTKWAEVGKTILSAQGMKIYYNDYMSAMKVVMKITGELGAETNILDQPLQAGMKRALEQYSARLLTQPGRTIMEEGY